MTLSATAPKTHTAAPWEVAEGGCALYTRQHRMIATFSPSEQGSVDAKLCSVAPEMKRMLESVEELLRSTIEDHETGDGPMLAKTPYRSACELLTRVRDVLQRSEWP